jgi:transcriptional regulator with XRE-family HTH domain
MSKIFIVHNTSNPVVEWLNNCWWNWEKGEGSRKTQQELADYLGIPRTTLSQYLSGKRIPSGENLEKIAIRFGPEVYVLTGQIPPELKDLIDLYMKLKPGNRSEFLKAFNEFLLSRGFERAE